MDSVCMWFLWTVFVNESDSLGNNSLKAIKLYFGSRMMKLVVTAGTTGTHGSSTKMEVYWLWPATTQQL